MTRLFFSALVAAFPLRASALPPTVAGPPAVRPCCMLGVDAPLRIGPLSTPLRVGNVVPWDRLGVHRYGNRSFLDERNGLVFSCAHGVLDTGHVRNAADWTGYLARELAAGIGRGIAQTFVVDDGTMTVELHGIDRPFDRDEAARHIAQRIAYDLAVWHEVATAAGYAPAPMVPDSASAFSPEDLHSDLLGARLGADAVAADVPFDLAMTRLLQERLAVSAPVDTRRTRRILRSLDGTWWDSTTRHIDPRFVRRRRYDTALPLSAWRPADAGCQIPPASMDLPTHTSGIPLDALYRAVLHPPPVVYERLGVPPGSSIDTRELDRLASHLASLDAAGHPPGGATPQQQRWLDYRHDPAADFQGFRLAQVGAFGGARGGELARGFGGGRLIGGAVESYGGDMETMRLTGLWRERRGFVTHLVGARARALYVCRDRDDDSLHGPLLAWFENCAPEGWLGLGGTLAEVQHDATTGRWVTRPIALHAAINLLGNAFDLSYLRRRLVLTAGVGLQTYTPGRDHPERRGRVSPQLDLELAALWRSHGLRLEVEAFSSVTQTLNERDDYGLEAGGRLIHRWVLGEDDGPADGYATLGIEAAVAHWPRPQRSLPRRALPMLSSRVPTSAYLVATLGLAWERFTL